MHIQINKTSFELLKVVVALTNGADQVYLYTNLPCPFNKDFSPKQPSLSLHFEATYNTGIEYIRKIFEIEPDVLVLR